jgi:hypothetical protein
MKRILMLLIIVSWMPAVYSTNSFTRIVLEKLIHNWEPPSDLEAFTNQNDFSESTHPDLMEFFALVKANKGAPAYDVGYGLVELAQEYKNDEKAARVLLRLAVAGGRNWVGGAGLEHPSIMVFDELLQSHVSVVRKEAAQILLMQGEPIRGGTHEYLEDRREANYVKAYFNETDREVKEQLKELVRLWDPDALVYGPKGLNRMMRNVVDSSKGACVTALMSLGWRPPGK